MHNSGGGEYLSSFNGFTLSEVLITLGVIGVVAALTIPGIIANANDSKYRGARQKALATIGEAVRNIAVAEGIDNASSAEDFVENYLKSNYKSPKPVTILTYATAG